MVDEFWDSRHFEVRALLAAKTLFKLFFGHLLDHFLRSNRRVQGATTCFFLCTARPDFRWVSKLARNKYNKILHTQIFCLFKLKSLNKVSTSLRCVIFILLCLGSGSWSFIKISQISWDIFPLRSENHQKLSETWWDWTTSPFLFGFWV